jgi:glycosyltransferase involved in cell wall biosynthesis
MALPLTWPRRARNPDSGVVFGFFGGFRGEKGAGILAKAIPIFAQQYPEVRFIVHAPPGQSDPTLVRILERTKQVELIQRNFTDKETYFASLSRAACLLLAYDPEEYAIRTSGIFLEALGLGRLIVTTSGTWMETELKQYPGAGIIMPHFTARDLGDALREARQRMFDGTACSMMRKDVVSENSQGSFCSQLLRLMEQ